MARRLRGGSGIHVEAHGLGAPILLTHGFGGTCRMWDEQVEALTDRYRLILWDLPGHGQSAPPRRGFGIDDLTPTMAALLDTETAEPAILIGLGLGGVLSLRFWHANRGRVRAMVLIGTLPGLRSAATRAIWNARVTRMATALDAEGLDSLEGGAEIDPRLHRDGPSLARAARALLIQTDEGPLPWLEEIDLPVLVLVGGEDRPNLTAARFMALVIPGARHIVVPRANHAANIHHPEVVNEAISDFLRTLSS